jgi:hypothetical protein
MFKSITVTPAYGRDYRSETEAKADWEAGKDFSIPGQGYVNNEDAKTAGISEVRIRFRKRTLLAIVKVG